MFFFDPRYLIFVGPALLLALYAQAKVSGTFAKYSKIRSQIGMSGAEFARRLLDAAGLQAVPVDRVEGQLTDHYDPRNKVLRLSESVYTSPSVAALGVVAHEVGHALQDKSHYAYLNLRSGLVPMANVGTSLGIILFMLGFFLNLTGLAWAGVIVFSFFVAFTLITLPVEFNASHRALGLLTSTGLVAPDELDGAKKVLDAAALTYVAAAAQAIGQLVYFLFILMGSRRED